MVWYGHGERDAVKQLLADDPGLTYQTMTQPATSS